MSIALKWFRIDVDETVKRTTNSKQKISFKTTLCEEDEMCTAIDHCFEAVPAASIEKKFCDLNKVCCKNKSIII